MNCNFLTLSFSDPIYFYVSVFLGLIIIFSLWFYVNPRLESLFKNGENANFLSSRLIIFLVGALHLFSVYLLSISAGGPFQTKKAAQVSKDIRDIYFVVDVSRSMLADDFIPNRLHIAKKYISKFIKMRSTDRIGLNIFAEKIITLSPLTHDHFSINEKVSEINVGFLGNGTNIGDALALATSRLSQSEAQSKVIILLTDGVSNAGSISPSHAGDMAKSKGVKIYAVGIGSEGDAFIPYQVGRRTMKQRIPGGNIDHVTLEKITSITGGEYYKAKNENALKIIFDKINGLEKTSVNITDPILIKYDYISYLKLGAFLFFVCEIFRRKIFRFSL